MINQIRSYIEKKRNSESIFWKGLILLKDRLRKSIINRYYWESLILEDFKTICFFIPKTASSSFRVTFYEIIKNKKPEKFDDVYTLPRVLKKNIQKHEDYFKFTIMRDPYEKLLSCYYDFIIDKRRERVIRDFPFYYGMSFKEFVKVVCSISDEESDTHFRSQHTFITNKGNLVVDYIAKYENLEIEYPKIMKKMGIENIPKLPNIKKSKAKAKERKDLYTNEIKEMVYERYKKDFEIYEDLK